MEEEAQEAASRGSQPPRIVLPRGAVGFSDRAARFRQLAATSALGPFLETMATLAEAQSWVIRRRAAQAVDDGALAACRDHGMPPLGASAHVRSGIWTRDLRDLVEALAPLGRAREALSALATRSESELDDAADRLLAGTTTDGEAAQVPFVGAALGVYYTRLAETLRVRDLEHCDVPTLCPVCASRPVASVVRIGPLAGLRYLACGLCGTEWNLARIKCSYCEEDRSLHYFGIESEGQAPAHPAWRAEACDECRTYLKIFYQEKDPQVDSIADDLASLGLDVLLDERGYSRSGPNILFHPGAG